MVVINLTGLIREAATNQTAIRKVDRDMRPRRSGKLSGTFSIKGRRFVGFRFVALSGCLV